MDKFEIKAKNVKFLRLLLELMRYVCTLYIPSLNLKYSAHILHRNAGPASDLLFMMASIQILFKDYLMQTELKSKENKIEIQGSCTFLPFKKG